MRKFAIVPLCVLLSSCTADQPAAPRISPETGAAAVGIADAPVGRVVPLPVPAGALSAEATAINGELVIVGRLVDVPGGCGRIVMWDRNGVMRDLGECGSPRDINNRNHIVGTFRNGRAFLWTPQAGFTDLGTLGGTTAEAFGINEAGAIVGSSTVNATTRSAFLYTAADGMRDLSTLSGLDVDWANAINRGGDIVMHDTTNSWVWNAAIGARLLPRRDPNSWRPGTGYKINDKGWVSGEDVAYIGGGDDRAAALWLPGATSPISLGVLGQPGMGGSTGYSLSEAGRVVGLSITVGPVLPFTWTMNSGIRQLDMSTFTACGALDINRLGTAAVGWCNGVAVKWLIP